MSTRLWGAHNALTAYRPRCPLMWAGAPVWRCQRRRPAELVARGARLFDWRVCRRRGRWYGAHGIVTLDVNPLRELDRLIEAAGGALITVRLILERGDAEDRAEFAWLCGALETWYTALGKPVRFIGGRYKPTWERLHVFAGDDIGDAIEQRVGSMDTRRRWGALWPWLWSRLYDSGEVGTGTRPLLRDFI